MSDFDKQMNVAKRVMEEEREVLKRMTEDNHIENDIKIRYIKTRLETLISEPELIDGWLNSPNSALGNEKPIDLIINGDANQLYRMLYVLETGEPLL